MTPTETACSCGAISPLSHRAPSARGRPRSCRPEAARSHRDQRGRRDDLPRLDVVDFHAFQALRAGQADAVVKVSDVSNDRIAHKIPKRETCITVHSEAHLVDDDVAKFVVLPVEISICVCGGETRQVLNPYWRTNGQEIETQVNELDVTFDYKFPSGQSAFRWPWNCQLVRLALQLAQIFHVCTDTLFHCLTMLVTKVLRQHRPHVNKSYASIASTRHFRSRTLQSGKN